MKKEINISDIENIFCIINILLFFSLKIFLLHKLSVHRMYVLRLVSMINEVSQDFSTHEYMIVKWLEAQEIIFSFCKQMIVKQ